MRPLSGPVLTAAEMHAAEIKSGIAPDILMERAGAALAEVAWRFSAGRPIIVICGSGNNGGDGYVAATQLRARGASVCVIAAAPPASALARAAAAAWGTTVRPFYGSAYGCVLIDAVFGTGLTRPMSETILVPLQMFVDTAALVIAADVPSGVFSDDGAWSGVSRADITVAFGAAKPAHVLQPSAGRSGRVLVADIDVPVDSMTQVLARPRLTAPTPRDHKYTRGMVGVIQGDMAGAATLAATAAAGLAGYTVLCGDADIPPSVVRRDLGTTIADGRLKLLVGPGMTGSAADHALLETCLKHPRAMVLDGGALRMTTPETLRAYRAEQYAIPLVLTPHEGEFMQLFGELPGSKVDRARAAAAAADAIIVYKGADTVIAAPDGRVAIAPAASGWLATAGSGDVLAGIVLAMLRRSLYEPFEAACAAVWLHGEAARRAGPAFAAGDLAAYLPAAVAACL